MPGSTATWAAPYPVLGDPADINAAVKPLADRLEALLTLIKAGDPATIEGIPIGVSIPYTGSVLPNVAGGPVWAWADGALVDKTTYGTFFTRTGHAYNGGVDPGANKVRLPDKRGRVPRGADNFGVGGASRITVANAARGGSAGSERVSLASSESGVPAHAHSTPAHGHGASSDNQLSGSWMPLVPALANLISNFMQAASPGFNAPVADNSNTWAVQYLQHAHGISIGTAAPTTNNNSAAGAAASHQNLSPYENDTYIVRIG